MTIHPQGRAGWRLLLRAVLGAPLRSHPGQVASMVSAVSLGVAMVFAIHLINTSGLGALTATVRDLAGRADLTLRSTQGPLPEQWLVALRALPGVRAAYPSLRFTVRVTTGKGTLVLPLLAVDTLNDGQLRRVYRPSRLTQEVPQRLFDFGAVLLGADAARQLDKRPGDTLPAQLGTATVKLTVIGVLPPNSPWADGMLMDVAPAQWTFQRIGELDRIDLRLYPHTDAAALRERLARRFGPRLAVEDPLLDSRRAQAMTRAYRVNLNVLSLVGLVTAGFLVYSLLSLSLRRQREKIAVLRTLGLTRRRLVTYLTAQGLLLGLAGSALGLVLGWAVAALGVNLLGGDLGAGYFRETAREMSWEWSRLGPFLALGVAVTLAGVLPATRDTLRCSATLAMARGAAEDRERLSAAQRAILLTGSLLVAAALSLAPAWHGLPLAGYGAVVLLLVAGILSFPPALTLSLKAWRLPDRAWLAAIALARVKGAPARAATVAGAVMVSFALVVAMSTMVHSFRESVASWLDQVLAADLYVRASGNATASYLDDADIAAVTSMPQVSAVYRARHQRIGYGTDSGAPPVMLTARDLDSAQGRATVALVAGRWPRPEELGRSVLVSEVFAALYHVGPGDTVTLPLGGQERALRVAGIWRDYAYQWGHVLMDYGAYRAMTGDSRVDDLGLFLAPQADREALRQTLARRFAAGGVQVRDAAQIRSISLKVFDQSFAVTYALVFIAVTVGLFGVINAQAVQAVERRSEIGVLRHLGLAGPQVARLLALEAGLLAALGALQGAIVGGVIAVVLVHVINRQSFLWSMAIQYPLGLLALVMLALVVVGAAFGHRQGRRLAAADVLRAVRDE